jgi:hypothetical protein
MAVPEFSPVILPIMVENPVESTFDDLQYESDALGKVKCSGPWNPRFCFPRKLICFQGCLFTVDILCRHYRCLRDFRYIFIPSSIQVLDRDCFGTVHGRLSPCTSLELVVFEPGAQLTNLGEYAFRGCSALKCIYLPPSVECISSWCFSQCTNFSHFGFESGSKLTSIHEEAFCHCSALKSIIIPASLSTLSGGAFVHSGIRSISIEKGCVNFKIAGDCIVDFNGIRLISYFGSSSKAVLSRDIEVLGLCC